MTVILMMKKVMGMVTALLVWTPSQRFPRDLRLVLQIAGCLPDPGILACVRYYSWKNTIYIYMENTICVYIYIAFCPVADFQSIFYRIYIVVFPLLLANTAVEHGLASGLWESDPSGCPTGLDGAAAEECQAARGRDWQQSGADVWWSPKISLLY